MQSTMRSPASARKRRSPCSAPAAKRPTGRVQESTPSFIADEEFPYIHQVNAPFAHWHHGNVSATMSPEKVQHLHAGDSCATSLTLENLPMDIWMQHIAPLLSTQEIVRMGAVSKPLQRIFDNPLLFKKLCMDRFGISPQLDGSYYDIFKLLSAAQYITDLDMLTTVSLHNLYRDDLPLITKYHIVHKLRCHILDRYTLITKATPRTQHPCDYSKFLSPSNRDCIWPMTSIKKFFPILPGTAVKKECEDQFPNAARRRYRLGDVIDLSVKKHGSVAAHQAEQIEYFSAHLPDILPLIRYKLRERRLQAVTAILRCLPAYYDTRFLLPNRKGNAISRLFQPVPVSQMTASDIWLQTTVEVCRTHSALRLYVKDRLRFRLEDYFNACFEFNFEFNQRYHMHSCSCPKVRSLLMQVYERLGSAMNCATPRSEYWGKGDIFQALSRCADKEVLKLQPALELATRASCPPSRAVLACPTKRRAEAKASV